jgi:hypothetical protein
MEEIVSRIKDMAENATVRIAPNVLVWKEGSNYDLEVTNKQFDELEKLLEEHQGQLYYLVDLSTAKRPPADIIQLVKERLAPINHRFKHTAVYTGNNYIMLLGIKYYFIRFDFPSYSAHSTIASALKSFS